MNNNKVYIISGASRGLGCGLPLCLGKKKTERYEEALKDLVEEVDAGTKCEL